LKRAAENPIGRAIQVQYSSLARGSKIADYEDDGSEQGGGGGDGRRGEFPRHDRRRRRLSADAAHGALIFMGFHILRVTHSRISPWLFPYVRPGRPHDVLFRFSRNGASPPGYIVPIPLADSVDARPLLQPSSRSSSLSFPRPSVAAASRSRMHRNPDAAKREIRSGMPLCPASSSDAISVVGFRRLRSDSPAESGVLVGVDPALFVGKKKKRNSQSREMKGLSRDVTRRDAGRGPIVETP